MYSEKFSSQSPSGKNVNMNRSFGKQVDSKQTLRTSNAQVDGNIGKDSSKTDITSSILLANSMNSQKVEKLHI